LAGYVAGMQDLIRLCCHVLNPVATLARDQRGATAIEYGLIMALIFLAMVTGVNAAATKTINMWTNVTNTVASVVG